MFRRFEQDRKGITGLETAIILIAFVVVASVFSFTVLSAGIFSAQQGKQAIHSGLQTAESSMQLVGSVIGEEAGTTTYVGQITFIVSNTLDGQTLNLATTTSSDNVLTVNYLDQNQSVSDLPWNVQFLGKNNGDTMLDPGEKAQITVDLSSINSGTYPLGAGDQFTLQVDPKVGSPLIIQRRIPDKVDLVMNLN